MDDLEKVLNGLECCVISDEESECPGACPYYDECWDVISDKECECPEDCSYYDECRGSVPINGLALKKDALALLKAQQPRVLTLEEVEDALDTVVWVDWPQKENSSDEYALVYKYSHILGWVDLRFVDGGTAHCMYKQYGEKWRCWNKRPTDEQRKAVKWDETEKDNG